VRFNSFTPGWFWSISDAVSTCSTGAMTQSGDRLRWFDPQPAVSMTALNTTVRIYLTDRHDLCSLYDVILIHERTPPFRNVESCPHRTLEPQRSFLEQLVAAAITH
jgi:hypothetical protein